MKTVTGKGYRQSVGRQPARAGIYLRRERHRHRAVGHLLETATPEAYGEQFGRPWRANVLPVIPETWQMVVKKETADQFAVIKSC